MKVLRKYKNSVKFICKNCGRAQAAGNNSRCVREQKCSQCLQKEWELGKVAYWG